jgi:hypothetical protein
LVYHKTRIDVANGINCEPLDIGEANKDSYTYDMQGFKIITAGKEEIKFKFYNEAPVTSKAFSGILPFTRVFYHARVSGQE